MRRYLPCASIACFSIACFDDPRKPLSRIGPQGLLATQLTVAGVCEERGYLTLHGGSSPMGSQAHRLRRWRSAPVRLKPADASAPPWKRRGLQWAKALCCQLPFICQQNRQQIRLTERYRTGLTRISSVRESQPGAPSRDALERSETGRRWLVNGRSEELCPDIPPRAVRDAARCVDLLLLRVLLIPRQGTKPSNRTGESGRRSPRVCGASARLLATGDGASRPDRCCRHSLAQRAACSSRCPHLG